MLVAPHIPRLAVLLAVVAAPLAHPQNASPARVHVQMRNVLFRFTGNIPIHILQLQGELISKHPDGVVVFDDSASFTLAIHNAKISISPTALSDALNRVFSDKNSPIKDVVLSIQGAGVKLKGKLHSKGDVPFEAEGTLDATSDGQVRIQTRKIKAAHLPVKGLMDLLGVDLAKLIETNKVRGLRAEKDDIILDPTQVFPPPEITGKLTSIQIQGSQIVETFGDPSGKGAPPKLNGNYMVYWGGVLRFGKLTMNDSDLALIDADPRDPFDFYLDHYKDQLVAGYSKTTSQDGLRVYMPDFSKLGKRK